jgi:hypothetical protein
MLAVSIGPNSDSDKNGATNTLRLNSDDVLKEVSICFVAQRACGQGRFLKCFSLSDHYQEVTFKLGGYLLHMSLEVNPELKPVVL